MPWFSCWLAVDDTATAGASIAGSSAGDLLVVFPEHPHQYGPEAGNEWDEVFIAFKGADFEGCGQWIGAGDAGLESFRAGNLGAAVL